jgi:hypothetical protein
MVIKRVGPVSCAKIAGTLYAVLGLLMGGVLSSDGGSSAAKTFLRLEGSRGRATQRRFPPDV